MSKGIPALFLDRDGVVNIDRGYVFETGKFDFFPEIFDICRTAKAANFPIVVVTNQSGIGRGYFTERDFQLITEWMISEFEEEGIDIALVLYAPENPESVNDTYAQRRKPSPIMIQEAAIELDVDLDNSIIIGDKESDMIAGLRAGISNRILIGVKTNSVASLIVDSHRECLNAISEVVSGIQEA
jgi:D-glycero-D-manno-heptose 1,7-bisphosphate phosphatase